MKKTIFIPLFLLLYISVNYAQFTKKEDRIRFGFGVSTLTDESINALVDGVFEETGKIGPALETNRFSDHITYFMEYEHEYNHTFSYLINLQYHGDIVSGSKFDQTVKTEQGMNYEFDLVEGGFNLVGYFPLFKIKTTQINAIIAGGPDLTYTLVKSFYFMYQPGLYQQKIYSEKQGMIFGGRIFTGVDIPFVESLFLQLRVGYNYRPKRTMHSEVTEKIELDRDEAGSKLDPEIFNRYNSIDFSQVWGSFNIAYRF